MLQQPAEPNRLGLNDYISYKTQYHPESEQHTNIPLTSSQGSESRGSCPLAKLLSHSSPQLMWTVGGTPGGLLPARER